MATQNDHPSYVMHVLDSIYVLFTLFGYLVGVGGRSPNGLVHTWLAYASFSLWVAQKSKFPKLIFFSIVTTHNDHPSYVKHVLGSVHVFFYPIPVCIARSRFFARWACQRIWLAYSRQCEAIKTQPIAFFPSRWTPYPMAGPWCCLQVSTIAPRPVRT